MDHDLVAEEVDRVRALGVNIVCNHQVGDVRALEKEYDHVVVSPGLQRGRKLPHIRGLAAVEFLESSNTDGVLAKAGVEGKRVVVIGGGSVAMDAAVMSKTLGASSVTAVFVESLDDMPADVDEIKQAQNYHITMLPERVVENMSDDGMGLHVRHVSQDDECDMLHADTVIMAIGQEQDSDTVANLLNHEQVEYAGDAVNGGATVVQAVAEGKQVAERISLSSTGRSFSDLDKMQAEGEEALKIEFCGIEFPNPFCLSSSPVSNTAEMCARAFDAGWGGVIYKTLNLDKEQEIFHPSPRLHAVHDLTGSSRICIGLQNVEQISDRSLADNLADIVWLKKKYPSHVLGVSVMGFSESGWKTLVRAAEDHGADWVELNFSCPQMRNTLAGHKVGQDVDLIERFTAAAKSACSIPVVAKMTPNITDMVPAALAAQQGGADAVSAVNTFKAISHVNVDYSDGHGANYRPQPNIEGVSSISGFSGPACRPLALRFIAEMAQDSRLTIPISGMGGIYSWRDAVEFLSLGASNLQCTTAVMHHGLHIIDDLKDGLMRHLLRLGHDHVSEIVGASLPFLQPPEKLDLSIEAVSTIVPDLCIGCGACVKSCRDGATDAIAMTDDSVARVDPQKCVGCLLCAHVCPVEGAVKISTRFRIAR
jgi:dihydropyrimidine dehydrogenase (NAD+) subunit PreA